MANRILLPGKFFGEIKAFQAGALIFPIVVGVMAANWPTRTFRIPGVPGTVGFISPLGEHFCQSCNRLRLTVDGRLRLCLVMPGEISLRNTLRCHQPLEELFYQAIAIKPPQHHLASAVPVASERGMSQVGG